MALDSRDMLVKIKGDTGDFEKSMKNVKGASDDAHLSFSKLSGAVAVGNLVAGAAQKGFESITGALEGAVKKTEDLGMATNKLMRETGMTAEQSSGLLAVFERFGIDAAGASKDLGLFSKQIYAAGEATGKTKNTFTDLGISVKDTHGKLKDTNAIMMEVADKFQTMPAGAEKTAEAMKLFGKSGKDMLPILNLGAKGIEEMELHAKKLGIVLTQDNVDAIRKNAKAQKDLQEAMVGVQLTIGTALMPVIASLATSLTSLVASDQFHAWAKAVADVVGNLSKLLYGAFLAILPTVAAAWKQVSATMNDWVIPAFVAIRDAIEGLIKKYPQVAEIAGIIAGIAIALSISPIGVLIMAIGFAVVELHQHFKQAHQVGTDAFKKLKEIIDPFIPLFTFLGGVVYANVIVPLQGLWQTIVSQLWPALKNLWDAISPQLIPVLQFLGIIVGATLVAAFVILANVIGLVINVIKGIIAAVSLVVNTVAALIDIFTGNFRKIPGVLGSILGNVGNIITAPFKDAFDWIKNNVGAVVDALKKLDPFKKHSPSLVELVTAGTKEIKTQYGNMYSDLKKMGNDMSAPDMVSPIASAVGINSSDTPAAVAPINITVAPQIGIYAGQPAERRDIAAALWSDLVKMARAQGVQLPNINVAGIQ